MGIQQVLKWTFLVAAMSILTGCIKGSVTDSDYTQPGQVAPPVWPLYPAQEPTLSVAAQNSLAMENLGKQGFETEQNEKGVVVYLPPSIHFSGGESKISIEAREKISQIANEVNKDYLIGRNIEIAGHTDTSGSENLNLKISEERSHAAVGELVFSKVDRGRLTAAWFGSSRPAPSVGMVSATMEKVIQGSSCTSCSSDRASP